MECKFVYIKNIQMYSFINPTLYTRLNCYKVYIYIIYVKY